MDNLPLTLGVKVAILYKDEVLLVKPSYHDTWGIPGGMIEKGEHPVYAGKREIKEELGIDIDGLTLFGVYLNTREDKIDYVFLYIVSLKGKHQVQVDNCEITDAIWWNKSDFTSDRIGHRTRNRLFEIWGEKPVTEMW